eukprot:g3552.t1
MLNDFHKEDSESRKPVRIDPEILDLKRLQMFYVAVKEGTFSAAAQSLGVSPSAVSHALKSLEEEVDCALFKRTGPHVSPTGAAIRLLPIVEELLHRMGAVRAELAKMDGRVERLTFGVSGSARVVLTTSVMSAFCECFPDADVEIVHTAEHVDHRSRQDLDFQIGCDENVPHDVVRRPLAEETLQLYAAPFHDLGLAGRVTISQLKQNVLVFPDRMAADAVARLFFQKSQIRLKKWVMPDAGSARNLALQGQCLAFLPESVAKAPVAAGNLNHIKTTAPPLTRKYSAWWNAGSPLPWIAEVFLSLLAVNFNPED